VSGRTFYEQFSNRQDCMLASFRELFERLCEEIDGACESEPNSHAKVPAAIRRALELFAAEPPVARLLTVEILAASPQGACDQHAAIERLAARLEAARELGARAGASAANSAWRLIALIAALISKHIVAGEPERLPGLEPELSQIVLASFGTAPERGERSLQGSSI
jgi:AcrR family transcriptional regulator